MIENVRTTIRFCKSRRGHGAERTSVTGIDAADGIRNIMFLRQAGLVFRIHRLVPAPEVLQTGQSCLAVEQVVAEYAIEIVIDEQRAIGQKKR